MRTRQTRMRAGGGKTRLATAATIAALMAVASAAPNVWLDPNDAQAAYTWRYNRLAYTEQFNNGAWSASNLTVTPDTDNAPDGNRTADSVNFTTTTSYLLQAQLNYPAVIGGQVTISVYAKTATRVLQYGGASPVGTDVFAAETLANGWFRQSLVRTFTANNSAAPLQFLIYSGAGFGIGTAVVWGAQFVPGGQPMAYQRVSDLGSQDLLNAVPNYTLFQDNLGTAAVTAVEQPVGLILDKSRGGAVRGTQLITNGDMSSAAGWTLAASAAIASGVLTITSGAAGIAQATNVGTVVAGKTYEVSFDVTAYTAGGVSVGTASGAGVARNAVGSYREIFTAVGSTALIVYARSVSTTATVDNVSVKEIPGNHASQVTAASRPVLSARVNQLFYSQDFSNAAGWVMTTAGTGVAPAITTAYATAPDGSNTANRVQFSTGAGVAAGDISQVTAFSQPTSVGGTYTSGIWLKSNTGANQTIRVTDITGATTSIVVTPTWQQFVLTRVATATASIPVRFSIVGTIATSADIQAWGAQFEASSTLSKYQRINAATDYDAAGFPMYLRFDGVDDSLATNSIDFTTTDKLSVVAGVRTATTTGTQILLESGASYVSAPGRFEMSLNEVAAGAFTFARTASIGPIANQYKSESLQGAPRIAVISVRSDFAVAPGSSIDLRTNGVPAGGTVSGSQVLSSYSNDPLFIGRRNNASNPFNGNLYGLIIFGRLLRPDDLNMAERFMAQRTFGGTI